MPPTQDGDGMIISTTATIKGRGQVYRWISGLTRGERNAVRQGETVLVPDSNTHYTCTPYKEVTYHSGRYSYRNYNQNETE